MIVAFWIVVPILTYLFVAGISSSLIKKNQIRRCAACSANQDGNMIHRRHGDATRSESFHDSIGAVGLVWPLALPFIGGQIVSEFNSFQKSKAQRKHAAAVARRAEELVEQNHQLELARLRNKENALLDQQLKLAEIRGRVQDA